MFHAWILLAFITAEGVLSDGIGSGRIVCYLDEKSLTRTGDERFTLEMLDPQICTHLIYSRATIEEGKGVVPELSALDIRGGGYSRVTNLKKKNPSLKVLLSIGGDEKASSLFSKMAADPVGRSLVIDSAAALVSNHSFDGVDIAWKFPGQAECGSSSEKNKDKNSFLILVQEMKKKLKEISSSPLLLSVLLPRQTEFILNGYDILKINKEVDMFNIIAFDFKGRNKSSAIHHSAMFLPPERGSIAAFSADFVVKIYARVGISLDKVNFGIPAYGRLITPKKGIKEVYSESEICQLMKNGEWKATRDPSGPFLVKDDLKISYEDEDSVRVKGNFAKDFQLGGIMFSTIDQMDYKGNCTNGPYRLIKAAKEVLLAT